MVENLPGNVGVKGQWRHALDPLLQELAMASQFLSVDNCSHSKTNKTLHQYFQHVFISLNVVQSMPEQPPFLVEQL